MIKVSKHGNRTLVTNPVNGQKTEMINVTFTEEGRSGGNAQLSDTSAFLSQFTGGNSGLDNIRVHTHPIKAELIGAFPVGKTLAGYINRNLYSTPQIRQQEGVDSRMVDGRPTYFTTYISANPEKDRDLRVSNETLMAHNAEAFTRARTSGTLVETVEVGGMAVMQEEVQHEELAVHGEEGLEA
jgi:hypothetical protein